MNNTLNNSLKKANIENKFSSDEANAPLTSTNTNKRIWFSVSLIIREKKLILRELILI